MSFSSQSSSLKRPHTSLGIIQNHVSSPKHPSLSCSSPYTQKCNLSITRMASESRIRRRGTSSSSSLRPQSAIRLRRRPQTTSLTSRCGSHSTYPIRSPFLVDLVAENERIDEENKVRRYRQSRKIREMERKREEAKNAIILRALQEANELEALRREKRKILEEEKRLKAMIEIEKLNAQRKEDRIKAERAERKRKIDKTTGRVVLNKAVIRDRVKAQEKILRIKLNIEDPPNNKSRIKTY